MRRRGNYLVAVKKRAGLPDRPLELLARMVEVLGELGPAVCPSGWGRSIPYDDFVTGVEALLTAMDVDPNALTPERLPTTCGQRCLRCTVRRISPTSSWTGGGAACIATSGSPSSCSPRGLLAVNPALDREERRAGMVPVTALGRWAVRRAHGGPAQGEPVLQLPIELVDSADPVIWRRVLVPAACPLVELHTVIQAAMGWQNGHLHQFSIGEVRYGPPGTDLDLAPEDRVRLDEVAGTGTVLEYLYDFGDDWEHQVTVEATTAAHADSRYPRCISGEGVCPPEDCGGIPGYELLRRTLADPSAPGHEDMLEWLGLSSPAAFDPARFDVRDADLRLAAQWRSTCPG